jgi:GR25 family glycosyltransferase involved in LPS biosynthesis
MAIPVVVLNLKSSLGRRAQITARLDGLRIAHRFFGAIDGRLLPASELDRLAPRSALRYERPLTPGEIACAASHLAVIRQIASATDQFVYTMEDAAVVSSVYHDCHVRDLRILELRPEVVEHDLQLIHTDPCLEAALFQVNPG